MNSAANATKLFNGSVGSVTLYVVYATEGNLDLTDLYGKTPDGGVTFTSALSGIELFTTTSQTDGKRPTVYTATENFTELTVGNIYDFAMLYYFEDTLGNGFMRHSEITTVKATSTTETDGVASFGWAAMNAASNLHQVYAPVPEPATAAMALAGLALLFRRKRK